MRKTKRMLLSVAVMAVFSIGARFDSPQKGELINAQSMYLYGTNLYVSDEISGINIYDVSWGAPVHWTTVPIEGNTGVAVRDSVIYANSWYSILAIRVHADGSWDTAAVIRQDPYCCYMPVDDIYYEHRGWGCTSVDYATADGGAQPVSGTGSSYAVFGVIDTFLYYASEYDVVTMSIADPDSPVVLTETYVGWDLETLFPTERFLFIGGRNGMYIMDRGNAANPRLIGSFQHAYACDPVVVADTIAYVTLRGGNNCGSTNDAFLSVSLGDPTYPYLLDQGTPRTPYGLSVNDTLAYIAKGYNGFCLYSIADPRNLTLLAQWPTPNTRDFIWDGNRLYLMGFTEVSVYDVTDPMAPVMVGSIQ